MRRNKGAALSWLMGCMLMFLMAAGFAAALPADFSADYEVSRDIFGRMFKLGEAELDLTRTDGAYRYVSHTWPIRVIAMIYGDEVMETSEGRLFGGLIRPDHYDFELKGRSGHSDYILFQWGKGEAEQRFKDETVRLHLPRDTLDRLSMQLAIMRDLAGGARDMQYLVADRNRVYAYHFEVTGSERLTTPLGEFDAVRVELTGQQRITNPEAFADGAIGNLDIPQRENGDRRTVFWCAPALDFIPVRVEYTDRDQSTYRMDIQSLDHPK